MKQDIRLYDFDFNLIYIISDWTSLNWELKYNGVGTFELHMPFYSGLYEALRENRYLVAVQGSKQAVITGGMLTGEIAIYGRTPNWLLGKRVILPFATSKATDYETLIRTKLGEVFDADDNLKLADATGDFEAIEGYELKNAKDALTFICECLEKENAGHRLTFKPLEHRWEFEIYRGSEKGIILSEDNRNAHSPKYTQDTLDMAGGIYYKDDKTGEYKVLPSDKQGICRWYAIGRADNAEDAASELEGLCEKRELTFETTDILYGKDYNLGDTFAVETSFGGHRERSKSMITGVRIWDEHLNCGESPVFEQKEADGDGV